MCSGTLIDDLIAIVERVEASLRLDAEQKGKMPCGNAFLQSEFANRKWLKYEVA